MAQVDEAGVVTLRRRDPMERVEWMFDRLCGLAEREDWEGLHRELRIMRFGLPAILPELRGLWAGFSLGPLHHERGTGRRVRGTTGGRGG